MEGSKITALQRKQESNCHQFAGPQMALRMLKADC
jgi:hypothetical protein